MSARDDAGLDHATVKRVLEEHPVRVAVLYGSQVTGTATAESDVDVAIEFESSLSADERHRARLALVVDLMEGLGVNDVDVTDLESIRPAVGASALRTGVVLVGSDARVAELAEGFEARLSRRTHEERMQEFDELIERLEEAV